MQLQCTNAGGKSVTLRQDDLHMRHVHAGMQSAALGFLLAREHFADPLVAVPSAVSVVFMALGGSGLAVFWRNKPTAPELTTEPA